MTTTSLPRRSIRYLLAKPVEPVRPVTGCDACDNGCHCSDAPGCEHWTCWGAGRNEQANTCPAAAAHREHMNAYKTYREALHAYNQQSHLR